jgi:hypothetical protein
MTKLKKKLKGRKTLEDLSAVLQQYENIKRNNPDSLYYTCYKKKKSKGGYRLISVPSLPLKKIQREIHECLVTQKQLFSRATTGFMPKLSPVSNSIRHRNTSRFNSFATVSWKTKKCYGKDYHFSIYSLHKDVVKDCPGWAKAMDIKDAFGSVSPELVRKALSYYLNKQKLDVLIDATFHKGKLPQGVPSSPVLLNLALKPLDQYIEALLKKKVLKQNEGPIFDSLDDKFVYTRFADDMVISSKHKNLVLICEKYVRIALRSFNLSVNKKKSRLMSTKNGIFITGINIVNGTDHVGVSKRYRDRIKCAIHELSIRPNDYEYYHKDRTKVMGRINHVLQVDSIHGTNLLEYALRKGVVSKKTRMNKTRVDDLILRNKFDKKARLINFT